MTENIFETIKKFDNNGQEYWSSRELAKALEYSKYANFLAVINKAKVACENSGQVIHNHFADIGQMVQKGQSILSIFRAMPVI